MKLPRFIDASAGTGKTHRLTWCALSALEQSEDVRAIVLCTFTVAATNELRERIRRTLLMKDEEFFKYAKGMDFSLEGLDRQALVKQVPALEIRTLDSYFHRLLNKLSPGQLSRIPTTREVEAVLRDSYTTWMTEDPQRMVRFGKAQDGTVAKALRQLAEGADGYSEEDLVVALHTHDLGPLTQAVITQVKELVEEALVPLGSSWAPTARSGDRVRPVREALSAWCERSGDEAVRLGKALKKLIDSLIEVEGAPLGPVSLLKEAREGVLGLNDLRDPNDPSRLSSDILRYIQVYREEMEGRGLMGNGQIAVKLLEALESAQDLGTPQPKWILVDEFQDTSPLQGRVLGRILEIMEGWGGGSTVVGDEKQAIYQFRGASTQPFINYRESVPLGRRESLETSWRASPATLAVVDSLIAPFLGKEVVALVSDSQASHHGIRPEVPLSIWACAQPELSKKGNWIKKGQSEGQKSLIDRAEDSVVFLSESEPEDEILVLGRKWQDLLSLSKRLSRRGLPVRVAGDPNLFSDPDVRSLVSTLRALAWPQDKVHRLAWLLGPAWAFTVEEVEKGEAEVQNALEALEGWADDLIQGRSAVEVLSEIIYATGWLYGLGGDERAHERRLRLLAAMEWLRLSQEEGSGLTAGDLADLMEKGREMGDRVHAPTIIGKGITLRTLHGAKGLEADHVVLIDPERNEPLGKGGLILPLRSFAMGKPAKGRYEPLPDGQLGGLWLPLPHPGNPVWISQGFMEAWRHGRLEEAKERINLVYVGLTRAKKTIHLVVKGLRSRQDLLSENLLGSVYANLGGDAALNRIMAEPDQEKRIDLSLEVLEKQGLGVDEAHIVYLPPAVRSAPVYQSKPSVREEIGCAVRSIEEDDLPDEQGWDALRWGDQVHRAMEILGPPGGGGREEGCHVALEASAKIVGEGDRIPAT
ncbi:UvrD-helicase domain-containing protein, partial [bacterium]|nr:UvrD-helicase domain-containing protein [bacterium]